MTKIKKNIRFSLNRRQGATRKFQIRMRITYSGSRIDIPIGHRIEDRYWDADNELVLKSCPKEISAAINDEIARYRKTVETYFKHKELDNIQPTVEELKAEITEKLSKKPSSKKGDKSDFFVRFDQFTEERGRERNWTESTYSKFATIRKHLYEFKPKMHVNSFDTNTIIDYLDFLLTKRKMRNSTIKKQWSFLKWFLRWMNEKEYSSQTAFMTYKPNLKTVKNKKVVFLEWNEIMHLYNLQIPETKQYLERVRDVFCFCCFTSLRYSDVEKLTRADIKNGAIQLVTKKTGDELIIEKNHWSNEILNKYKDYNFPNDRALPVISNSNMNDYLKELGKLAGFTDDIKIVYYVGQKTIEEVVPKYTLMVTHMARRSFISNALGKFEIPVNIIMEWTGHSSYEAMRPYVEMSNKMKEEAMKKFGEIKTEE